jgi:dienelactone hydrolase
MKRVFFWILFLILGISIGFVISDYLKKESVAPANIISFVPRTLDKYTIENISGTTASTGQIQIGEVIKESGDFTSSSFSWSFDPTFEGKAAKKVTGLINIPNGKGPFPVVIMFRGYVDQKIYQTGDGTKRGGEYFAQNGFVTIAPDFLGYGESDKESSNIFESRFQTYTTAVSLFASLEKYALPGGLWDGKNIFIWGHSNGGHVALATLEITGKPYPTTLWAPVSQAFPYSILYYLDETEDSGKLIIQKLSDFFDLYDPKLYSITNYWKNINKETPIQLHHGTADLAVPLRWSTNLSKILKSEDLKVNYFTYSGADHNLQPSWNDVVRKDLQFFLNNLK